MTATKCPDSRTDLAIVVTAKMGMALAHREQVMASTEPDPALQTAPERDRVQAQAPEPDRGWAREAEQVQGPDRVRDLVQGMDLETASPGVVPDRAAAMDRAD